MEHPLIAVVSRYLIGRCALAGRTTAGIHINLLIFTNRHRRGGASVDQLLTPAFQTCYGPQGSALIRLGKSGRSSHVASMTVI